MGLSSPSRHQLGRRILSHQAPGGPQPLLPSASPFSPQGSTDFLWTLKAQAPYPFAISHHPSTLELDSRAVPSTSKPSQTAGSLWRSCTRPRWTLWHQSVFLALQDLPAALSEDVPGLRQWPGAPAPTLGRSPSLPTRLPQSASGSRLPVPPVLSRGCPVGPLLTPRPYMQARSPRDPRHWPWAQAPWPRVSESCGSPGQPTPGTLAPKPALAGCQPRHPSNHLRAGGTSLFLVESERLFKDSAPTAACWAG